MGAVYAGWLTKSPEDRKGLFSLFSARQQWRRRYFVLYSAPITSSSSSCTEQKTSTSTSSTSSSTWTNHASSLSPSSPSSSPVLVYYEDEEATVRKGIIDLENCEEIVDHVESCYYRHLFLLKTSTHRGRQRTYYLAADTSVEVNNWVRKLRSTLSLYEDKLFTNTVLSITKSGSDVTGIIATVSNSGANSETSKTSPKKAPVNESSTFVNPEKTAVKQLSHIHWLIVNSESPAKRSELLPNNAGLCDSNSGISVSKCGTKVTNQKIVPPFKPNASAETRSIGSVSAAAMSSVYGSSPSSATPSQSSTLQNEASLSGNGCSGQTGANYCEDWPKFVKELLDDGDEHQGTEKEEGQEGKVEGKSVFYVYNMSSFPPDTKTNPNDAQKGQRPHSPKSNDYDEVAQAFPSTQSSSDVTCYLRITNGSRRYKSQKKRTQNIRADLF